MRCSSYCSPSNYNLQQLIHSLNISKLEAKYFNDVVHVNRSFKGNNSNVVDIFYFEFGAVVIWGGTEKDETIILDELNNIGTHANIKTVANAGAILDSKDINQNFVGELIYYHYDFNSPKTYIDEEANEIILHDKSILIKLSIAHALAQSVKLKILEFSVSKLLDTTAPIRQELSRNGSVSLSKKELSKQIGILFNERYSVNLHSDILNTPQFFWRRPRYEPLYLMTVEFQDIELRQNIMNHRLAMIHELYSILSNELNYLHSTRLELIIVGLIAIEVVLALLHNDFISRILS